jgi:hypothetical protein
MATVDNVIDQLQSTANSALSSARQTASRIGFVDVSVTNPGFDFTVNDPNLAPPPTLGDLFPGTDTSSEIVRFGDAQTEAVIDKYFPELNACLRSKPEEWCCNILSGDNEYGLNRTVFEIVWQRARDREYRSGASSVATLANDLSNRGFTLPPGTLIQAQVEANLTAQQNLAEVNREQQIQEATIKLDLLKFAEEQAIRLKLGLLDAIRGFYQVWFSVPDKDIERGRIRAQAQASLYNALASYYNVELGFEELRLRAEQARTGVDLETTNLRIQNLRDGRNGALGLAVQGFSDVAAAASNAGGALVAEITSG